jgi:hypothetical protein
MKYAVEIRRGTATLRCNKSREDITDLVIERLFRLSQPFSVKFHLSVEL